MKLRFFDFEVYPHWWCVSYGDFPDVELTQDNRWTFCDEKWKDDFVTVTSDMPNCRQKMVELMQNVCNVGYNIKDYDLKIANAIFQGFTPEQVRIISDLIVHAAGPNDSKEHQRLAPFAFKRMSGITYLDLFDSSTGSLKDKEAILGLSVQETSVPFDKEDLTEEDKLDIIKYNKHDVFSSMHWYSCIVEPFIHAKLMLAKKFNIETRYAYIDTNAGLVIRALGAKKHKYSDEEEIRIKLPTKIEKYCYDNLPINVLEQVLNDTKTYKVVLFDNEVVFADGGIHSKYLIEKYKSCREDTPVLYVQSDDEYVLINVDGESYYPSMMVQFKTLSRSIPNPDMFNEILQERFAIKHKPNKTKDDNDTQLADKLVLNTTFGASGSEYLALYDPYQRTRTCRYGQLFLIALANKLYKTIEGLKIIQTNTDGVLCYLRRSDIFKLKECMKEWTEISGIGMEEDYVDRIWQRDVNNYLMIKKGGKEKIKGSWLNQTIIRPGAIMIAPQTAYVCAKAVSNWLVKGKDIVSSLVAHDNLMDFTITTKTGGTYKKTVHRLSNGLEIDVGKANRLIATTNDKYGKLYKVKINEKGISYTQMPNTPERCLLLNDDMRTYNFKDIKKQLDYNYYLERCHDLLDMTFVELSHDIDFKTNQFDYFI